MLYLRSLKEAEETFKALSAPMRLRIMELIYENSNLSLNDLAEILGLTNSAISLHVSKLEHAGLVTIKTTSGKRGIRKVVQPVHDKLIVDLAPQAQERPCHKDDIAVGHYISIDAHPTCGLASPSSIIGEFDNPKMFSYPERFSAGILWIGWGSVTYDLPNRLHAGQRLTELQISFEISSECPEVNEDYPSDIYFDINGVSLGKWISPGDYGSRKGMISPSWWPDPLNQYGLLKTLIITKDGSFIDGTHKISNHTIHDLKIDYNSSIHLTFSCPKNTANCGGLTLFGQYFGDYGQDISVKAYYEDISQ